MNLVVFVIVSIIVVYNAMDDPCMVQFDETELGYKLGFNVCNLRLENQPKYYIVNDARYGLDPYDKVKYYFNIASPVLEYPPLCEYANASYKNFYDNTLIPITGLTESYKVTFDDNNTPLECYPTSGTFGQGFYPFSFKLAGPNGTMLEFGRPAYGFEYTNQNGQYNETLNMNSLFNVVIVCDQENWDNIPDTELVYYVYTWNMYYIRVFSVAGCPYQCPMNQFTRKVCSGYSQGRCGIDYVINKPKCFCLYGYSGDDCSNVDVGKQKPPKISKPEPSDYSVNFTVANGNVIYDANPFVLDRGYYEVIDLNNENENWNTRLIFNVMKKISPDVLPDECQGIKPSYAYIIQKNHFPKNVTCYSLGDAFDIEIFDDNQPANGVNFKYFNGSLCGDDGTRSFDVTVICSNQQSPSIALPRVFANSQIYFEDVNECSVVAPLYMSPAGCGYECVNEKEDGIYGACNQHGYCSYDDNVGYTRCLCYDGYTGPQCGQAIPITPSPPNNSNNGISPYVYIILANIIIIFIVVIIFSRLYNKWKQRMYLSINDPLNPNTTTTDDNTSSGIDIQDNMDVKFLK